MSVSVVLASLSLLASALLAGCSSTSTIGFSVEDPASVRSLYLLVGPQDVLTESTPQALVGPGARKKLDAYVQFRIVKDESGSGYKIEPPKNPVLAAGIDYSPTETSTSLEGSLEFPRELGEKDKKCAALIIERAEGAADPFERREMTAKDVAEGNDKEWLIKADSVVSP